jgi:two-component system, chemotaxis family, CheB/CheR fusion protein
MVEDLWGLRNNEVVGKSIFSLDIGLPMEKLRTSIRDCLSGQKQFEEMILDAVNRRGKQINCYVAITPLSSMEVEGAVLMMADIDTIKSMVSTEEITERQRQQL